LNAADTPELEPDGFEVAAEVPLLLLFPLPQAARMVAADTTRAVTPRSLVFLFIS
jgi:hypothetical protein